MARAAVCVLLCACRRIMGRRARGAVAALKKGKKEAHWPGRRERQKPDGPTQCAFRSLPGSPLPTLQQQRQQFFPCPFVGWPARARVHPKSKRKKDKRWKGRRSGAAQWHRVQTASGWFQAGGVREAMDGRAGQMRRPRGRAGGRTGGKRKKERERARQQWGMRAGDGGDGQKRAAGARVARLCEVTVTRPVASSSQETKTGTTNGNPRLRP